MKNFFKRVLSVFLSFCIILSCSFVGFAAGGVVVDYAISTILDYFVNSLTEKSTFTSLVEAARYYYFFVIVNDKYNSGFPVFDSSCSFKFSDDILDFYFNKYVSDENYFDPDGDVYLAAAGFGDIQFRIGLLGLFGTEKTALLNKDTDDGRRTFCEFYNTLLARYILDKGGEAKDPNPGKTGFDIAPGYVTSDDFNAYIEQQNTTNTPKGHDLFKQSRRTDKHFWSVKEVYVNSMPLFDDNRKSQFKDLYLVPFFSDDNATQYYSNYQFHLYYVPCEDPNADFSLYLDTYQFNAEMGYVLLPSYSGWIADFTSSMLPYALSLGLFLGKSSSSGGVGIYDLDYYTLEGYTNIDVSGTYNILKLNIPYAVCDYFANDGTKAHIDRNSSNASGALDLRYGDKSDLFLQLDPDLDLGFVCSKSLIKREYNIDTSRIPPNQVINITGDTIYDYSITNPDTGATSTINEYITNNYTYITNEGDNNGGGSGGGVGGNVTVGGNISVGGQVGVDITVSVPDININVNQGSGAGGSGTGINPDDILDGSSVDLDKYYGDAVSQASGVRLFLEQFFDFLPVEIVGLLGMLVAVAIVCRIFGR